MTLREHTFGSKMASLKGVTIHWTGLVDYWTGLDYCTQLLVLQELRV
jgi:hypothetical protein